MLLSAGWLAGWLDGRSFAARQSKLCRGATRANDCFWLLRVVPNVFLISEPACGCGPRCLLFPTVIRRTCLFCWRCEQRVHTVHGYIRQHRRRRRRRRAVAPRVNGVKIRFRCVRVYHSNCTLQSVSNATHPLTSSARNPRRAHFPFGSFIRTACSEVSHTRDTHTHDTRKSA